MTEFSFEEYRNVSIESDMIFPFIKIADGMGGRDGTIFTGN